MPALIAEVVVGLTPDGPRLRERRAAQHIRTGAQRRVEDAAAGSAHLGVIGVDLDLQVFERLDRRVGAGAVAQVGDRHAVQRVVVAAPRAAAEREQGGVGLILLTVELRVSGRDHRRDRGRRSGRRTRPGEGSVWSDCVSSTVPVEAVDVSIIALCPLTVTVSESRADLERHVHRDELLGADA